ncbi:hypothetical protein ACFYNW_34570 [Streptomyces virginiae]|uniref:hypothetical protein n=1 Tax=Streptomyces virginiae TaxID=1961 RepID=UPI0036E948E9
MSLADLALLLDAPVEALRGPKPEEHVWHVSVRNAPGDRLLSDAEWGGGRRRHGACRGHRAARR